MNNNPAPVTTSDAERAALLPCPFCGAHRPDFERCIAGSTRHRISCTECPGGAEFFSSTEQQAAAAWNRRERTSPALRIDFKQATQQGGWQPISTAPKDGTNIMLTNGVHVAQGWWEHEEPSICERRDIAGAYIDQQEHDGFDGWLDCDGGMQPDPTHWMPLPAAPQSEEGSLFLGVADGDAVGGKSGGDA